MSLITPHEGLILECEGLQPECPSSLLMKVGFWNVRGFNRPLKQNGVAHLIKNNHLCLLGILETKLDASAVPRIMHRSFPGLCQTNNFDTIAGERILVIWNPAVIDLSPEDISPQVIHCYEHVGETFGTLELLSMPWLILGDFNSVKSPEKKQLGIAPTCEGNPVWCKLDHVLLNNEWLEAELHCGAHFSPSGCLSDHSLGIVSLFDPPAPKPKSFRFFNMWADHPNFLATVENGWNMNIEGTPQFSLL
ncbi:UNVERIFIED_CONTAM: hypothetical protein Slati_3431100 [Sesamum latifolium]|uniref:Endonuclease/exonuclease/phosphatase domain-containing protein n=1 Tax=Sesamum latifolium TaxID=2727402 RepID=A0AAW2UG84_9LAMI